MSGTGWSFASHNAHLTVSEFLKNILCLVCRLRVRAEQVEKEKRQIIDRNHRVSSATWAQPPLLDYLGMSLCCDQYGGRRPSAELQVKLSEGSEMKGPQRKMFCFLLFLFVCFFCLSIILFLGKVFTPPYGCREGQANRGAAKCLSHCESLPHVGVHAEEVACGSQNESRKKL